MSSIKAYLFALALSAIFSGTSARAQSLVPICERLSMGIVQETQKLSVSFVLFDHDTTSRSSASCRIPLTRLQSLGAFYSIDRLAMTLYWERNFRQFPFILRVLSASTGQEIEGQASQVGLYSTMDFEYTNLLVSTADDLIIEVQSKSGKTQYVGLSGHALGDIK